MLSHDNYTWTANILEQTFKFGKKDIRMISYLPLSHVAA